MNNRIYDKTILVTGGSGSLGRHLIKELLNRGVTKIISLSRDEGLIKDAREFVDSDSVRFLIGDINDSQTLRNYLKEIDIVIHTAAMKDVVFAEKYPREILKSNILGVLNILDHAEDVRRFINISSDKAIGVVNCYGASKLLGEYLVSETNQIYKGDFINVRCPNFLGSRGSVIDIWKKQAAQKGEIILTDESMTRFFITLEEAASFIADLVFNANIDKTKIYYPFDKTKKFALKDLAAAFVSFYPKNKIKVRNLGKRTGEKIHENYVADIDLVGVDELKKLIKPLMS